MRLLSVHPPSEHTFDLDFSFYHTYMQYVYYMPPLFSFFFLFVLTCQVYVSNVLITFKTRARGQRLINSISAVHSEIGDPNLDISTDWSRFRNKK